jgi:hypothetical protein
LSGSGIALLAAEGAILRWTAVDNWWIVENTCRKIAQAGI